VIVADSHEFIELYRGDKDLRMGMEMCKLDPSVRFVSFAPDKLSPNDRAHFRLDYLADVGLPELPDRMEVRLLPSASLRFASKESGGIVALSPGYSRAIRNLKPDIIMENPFSWLTPRSYQTHWAARRLRVPIVYYDPGDDIPISRKHALMSFWETPVVRYASAIITYNEAGRLRFMRKYGYPEDRIHVIPKPVDIKACRSEEDASELRRSWGAVDETIVIGYLGRLASYKGSQILLNVARNALGDPRLGAVRFVFIGGALGSQETEATYRLANTYVTGMVDRNAIPVMLAACDVLVFPNFTNPGGFPTAVAEAMAVGKPIIAGIGRRRDLVPLEDGETALLVEPGDESSLTEALVSLASDAALRRRLGENVAAFAEKEMAYPKVAADYLDILREAVEESSTSRRNRS